MEQSSAAPNPPPRESAPPAPPLVLSPSIRLAAAIASQDGDTERRLTERRAAGRDVINLSYVEPDLAPPALPLEALRQAATSHSVRGASGLPEYRSAVARWYHTRFKISLDPNREVLPLPSVEEGVLGLAQTLLDPGDIGLVPDPGRPIYALALATAGARAVALPLRPEQDFLPELKAIPSEIAAEAKVLLIDYPNVPTGAVAPASFFHQVIQFAQEHGVLVIHLANLSEFTFDGYRSISLLEIPGSRRVCVELHSPSQTYHLAGWPGAVAAGNADALRLLRQFRQQWHSLSFVPAQQALAESLVQLGNEWVAQRNLTYQGRRDHAIAVLEGLGLHVRRPKAVPALWASVPAGYTSREVTDLLLEQAAVWLAPGSLYGPRGEGFVRLSLTADDARFTEALRRLADVTMPPRHVAPPADELDEATPDAAPRPAGEEPNHAG